MGIRFLIGAQELHVFACFSQRIGRGPVVGGAAQKKSKNLLTGVHVSLVLLRMKLLRSSLAILIAAGFSANAQTTATTDPVGFVTTSIAAGTLSSVRNTFFSIPLQEVESITGQVAGQVTGVTSNSLINTNAGWAPGALSQPSTPYIVQLTSGAGAGRIFLIAANNTTSGASGSALLANTASNVFLSPLDSAAGVNLTSIGVAAGDNYKIYACDTLSSFFGTPASSGVRGGSATTNSDVVTTIINGSAGTYWYNTTATRWARQGPGSADSANVALVPNYGIVYGRRTNSPLVFTVTGQVPVSARTALVKNSGQTMLSSYWPAVTTLSNIGLQSLPIWTGSTVFSNADFVTLTPPTGSAVNYWWDATANSGSGGWRRQGPGNTLTNPPIEIGTAVQVTQRGSANGSTPITNNVPYSLN